MLIKFRIHSDSSNPNNKLIPNKYIECVCDIKDVPTLVTSGINGEFEYENVWYDFCNGDYVTQPEHTSTYYIYADCTEDMVLSF